MTHFIELSHIIEDGMVTYTILLGAEVPIVEHMRNLGALPDSGFKFFAVPPPITGVGSFPVRAFAIIE